jgi:porphobilinogen deaminase
MPAFLRELRIGTRGSQLALWQANTVAARIAETGGPSCRIVTIRTSGDRLQEAPLSEVGGKRLFVKEIEDALLRGEIDLAVHSSKDMPAILPDGLTIAAVLPREDPLDAIVLPSTVGVKADATQATVRLKADTTHATVQLKPDTTYEKGSAESGSTQSRSTLNGSAQSGSSQSGSAEDRAGEPQSPHHSYVASGFSRTFATIDEIMSVLGQSPVIGTGSVRRIAQLKRLVPGARFVPIRGNLDTRLRKLDNAEYDALVLAAAGLRRLGFADRISLAVPPVACVPAPGQGIVAIEIREDDEHVRRIVARIDDDAAAAALEAERALVAALGGGCQTPIGALASPLDGDELDLIATVVSVDGSRAIRRHGQGPRAGAASLGVKVAAGLLDDGAGEILADARQSTGESQRSTVADVRATAMTDE